MNRLSYILLFICLASVIRVQAQTLAGVVIDKGTGQPLSSATVAIGKSQTVTDFRGQFEIKGKPGDSLKVTRIGYTPYLFVVIKPKVYLHIELEPSAIKLNEITINGAKYFRQDSINNRISYAKQFNYRAPKLIDAFSTGPKQPGELISINLLAVFAALTKKSTPEYKFNKILLRDEQAGYVDQKFNKAIVSQITGLKGDTLSMFLSKYRPTYQFALKSTEYDMEMYIKDSLKDFEKNGMIGNDPFKKPVGSLSEP